MANVTETYNGWTNYETWNVALWMDNDQGSYLQARDDARDCLQDADNNKDAAKSALSDLLKEQYESAWQEIVEAAKKHVHLSSSVWMDLMGAALSEVNWYEIAGNLIDEVYEDE